MKKLLLLTTAALLLMVPELKAQDADDETPAAGEEKTEGKAEAAGGEKKAGEKKANDKEAKASAKAAKAAAKNNIFASQQKKIQNLMDKLKKAKKKNKRRIADSLKREQISLRNRYLKEVEPIKKQIAMRKELLRIDPKQKEKIEKEIAALEEKQQSLEAAADLEKWCPDLAQNKDDDKEARK